jgi:alpha-L-arabinofuranosidase
LVQDEQVKGWWNIGGWGNTRHAIEMDGIFANEVPGRIETDRWYDIRIELTSTHIKCYLDNQLIHDVPYPRYKALYAVASRANRSREVILKVVNTSHDVQETDIQLGGANLGRTGTAITLSSNAPEDENSLDQPLKVAPVKRSVDLTGSGFRYGFPGNSVTVLRLPVR